MARILLLALVLLTSSSLVKAQFLGLMDGKTAKAIKGGSVVVQTTEADPKMIKKLEKMPDEQTAYLDGIAASNEGLEKAFDTYWKFTDEVTFSSAGAIKASRKGAAANQFLIYVRFDERKLEKGEPEGINRSASLCLVKLSDDPEKVVNAYQVPLPHVNLSQGDIIYGIRLMNMHLTSVAAGPAADWKKAMRANSEALKTKTLLVNSTDLDTKVEDTEKLKKFYSRAIEASDDATIEEAITTENQQFAYVAIVRAQAPNTYTAVVVDAATGGICATSSVMGTTGPIKEYPTLKEKNIRDFAKNIPADPAPAAPVAQEEPAKVEEPVPAPVKPKTAPKAPVKPGSKAPVKPAPKK